MMQNFHVAKVFREFAGRQAMQGRLLSRLSNMHQNDHDTARHEAPLRRFKQVALQIVRNADKVPCLWLDAVLPLLEIGHSRVNGQASLPGTPLQNLDSRGGAVHCAYFPSPFCKPQRIAPRAARQIEGAAGRQLARHVRQKRHRPGREILACAFARAVALFPFVNFHSARL